MTKEKLDDFKSGYQGSDEEKRDVLAAYTSFKGRMNSIFNTVMLSNPLDDEDRFRAYIDQAIREDEVEAFDAYANEPKKAREKRAAKAKKESEAARAHAKDIGIYDLAFGVEDVGKRDKASIAGKGEPDLKALLQQRATGRAANFLENLEAKYGGGLKKEKGAEHEPPEETFQKAATRTRKRKTRVVEHVDSEEEIDLEADSPDDEPVAPTRRKKSKRTKLSKR